MHILTEVAPSGKGCILTGRVTLEVGSLRGASSTHADLPTIGSQGPEDTDFVLNISQRLICSKRLVSGSPV